MVEYRNPPMTYTPELDEWLLNLLRYLNDTYVRYLFRNRTISGTGDIYGNIHGGTISGTIISGTIVASGVVNHEELSNLDYDNANHTGFTSLWTDQTITGAKTFTSTVTTSGGALPSASGTEDIGSDSLPYDGYYGKSFLSPPSGTEGAALILGNVDSTAASYAEIFDGGADKPGYINIHSVSGTDYYLSVTNSGGLYIDTSVPSGAGINSIEFGASAITIQDNLIVDGLTGSRMVSTDANKQLASVADLTTWISGTANRITVTDNGNGTVTLSAPQDLHTAASPTFSGATFNNTVLMGANNISGTGTIYMNTVSGYVAVYSNIISGTFYGDGVNITGSDHGTLNGLGDDDHTQYLLAAGTRALTGSWNWGSYTISGTGDVIGSGVSLIHHKHPETSITGSWSISDTIEGYDYYREITIDKDYIDANLTNFPVLVKLDSVNFDFAFANASGADIIFTDADNNVRYSFEREYHDSTAEEAYYWVRIPSVSSGTDTVFRIHYGNATGTDTASGTTVWDSNFTAVYHMSDDPDTSTIQDSTTGNNDGTKGGAGDPVEIAGTYTYKAQDFEADDDDHINIGSGTDTCPSGAITVETWVKLETWSHYQRFVARQYQTNELTSNSCFQLGAFRPSDVKGWRWSIVTNNGTYKNVGGSDPSAGTWAYIVGTYDAADSGGAMKLYLNGSVDNTGTADATGIRQNLNRETYLGTSYWDSHDYPFDGVMDEVRISKVARSEAWLKATYNTVLDNLLSYSAQFVAADDEPFLLKDGTRSLTGHWDYGRFTLSGTGAMKPESLEVNNQITIENNDITNAQTNGSIDIYPNGTGDISITSPNIRTGNVSQTAILLTQDDETAEDGAIGILNSGASASGFIWMDENDAIRISGDVDDDGEILLNALGTGNVGIQTNSAPFELTVSGTISGTNIYGIIPHPKGYSSRATMNYTSTTQITVEPGIYDFRGSSDRSLYWDSDIVFTAGPNGSNSDSDAVTGTEWHYLYLDDSAINGDEVAASDLLNSLTAPTYNDTKKGYYNSNDRCIFAFHSTLSGTLGQTKYYRPIVIDKTKIDAALTNFPVRIEFDSSNFDFGLANSSGTDLRFSTVSGSDTNTLDFEREYHDTSITGAVYYVKVPSIATGTDTTIYVHYGGDDSTDMASGTNVWDSNYEVVYHMEGSSTTIEDSTSNNWDLTKKDTNEPSQVANYGGQSFDGNDDRCRQQGTACDTVASAITMEAYIKPLCESEWDEIMAKQYETNNASTNSCFTLWVTNANKPWVRIPSAAGGDAFNYTDGTALVANNWYYLSVSYDSGNGNTRMFKNGTNLHSASAGSGAIRTSTSDFIVGATYFSTYNYWYGGVIKEVRVSNIARSDAWQKASAFGQDNSLLSVGAKGGLTYGGVSHGLIDEFFMDNNKVIYGSDTMDLPGSTLNGTWEDTVITLPSGAQKAIITIMMEHSTGTPDFRWRTNGASGTGNFMGRVSTGNTVGNNTLDVITDSDHKIEVKSTVSGNDLTIHTSGWYLPTGM